MISDKTSSAKTWNEKWKGISDGKGGGQSHTKIVHSKIGEEPARFLKVLRHQNDLLRRTGMFREVTVYQTLDHPAIPKIVDTNVKHYEDRAYKLYLVTELIEGKTLEQVVEDEGPLSPETAIRLVIRLLDIVHFCHTNDTIHRDIKPDNVILKAGDPAQVALVDFGLSFNKDDPPQHGTPSDEELGNRFCRLPELSASSRAKQDPRSDVTFCVGILLYAVTGKSPVLLIDEQDKMPHQRTAIRDALQHAVADESLWRMRFIFDRGFQVALSKRWQSADELRKELELLLQPPRADGGDYEALRERVRAYIDQPQVQAATRVRTLIEQVLQLVTKIAAEIPAEEEGKFIWHQTGHKVTSDRGKTVLAITSIVDERPVDNWIRFIAEVVGNEIVLSGHYRDSISILLRTELENLTYDDGFEKRVKGLFYRQMSDTLS